MGERVCYRFLTVNIQWSVIANNPTGFDPIYKYFYKTKPIEAPNMISLISSFGTVSTKYFISKSVQFGVESSIDGIDGANSFRYWVWNMNGELIEDDTRNNPENIPFITMLQLTFL